MPLNHVSMWTDETGWQPITEQEATKLHPGGSVSASSGLFKCCLCEQYVSFTKEGNKKRHFRHNKAEQDKECNDRTFIDSTSSTTAETAIKSVFRIKYNSDGFEFEIGLVQPPNIERITCSLKIQASNSAIRPFLYNASRWQDGITYFYVGDTPSHYYTIETVGMDIEEIPNQVSGISDKGTLFDKKSGKRLPDRGDVCVGVEYLLLTRNKDLVEGFVEQGIKWDLIYKKEGFCLYSVIATDFNEIAARFFLDYRYNLTKSKATLYPLWPLYANYPYVIRHIGNNVYIYLEGKDIKAKLFPDSQINTYCVGVDDTSRVLKISCKTRQQTIIAARTTALKELYLWKDELSKTAALPEITVKNGNGEEVSSGLFEHLPPKKSLTILAPYDGILITKYKGIITEKRKIQPDSPTIIDQIRFDQSFFVFQGLDCVWSTEFKRSKPQKSIAEKEFVIKLESCTGSRIAITHSLGAIANRLQNYPLIRQWLYQKIREGYASEAAIKKLKKFVIDLEV